MPQEKLSEFKHFFNRRMVIIMKEVELSFEMWFFPNIPGLIWWFYVYLSSKIKCYDVFLNYKGRNSFLLTFLIKIKLFINNGLSIRLSKDIMRPKACFWFWDSMLYVPHHCFIFLPPYSFFTSQNRI